MSLNNVERVSIINTKKRLEQLFLAVPWGCLRFVIVVFPDHTHLLFLILHIIIVMLNFSLVLMKRLNKTESDVFLYSRFSLFLKDPLFRLFMVRPPIQIHLDF